MPVTTFVSNKYLLIYKSWLERHIEILNWGCTTCKMKELYP